MNEESIGCWEELVHSDVSGSGIGDEVCGTE
jgi:hypothetical protein